MKNSLDPKFHDLYTLGYTVYLNEQYLKATEIFQALTTQEPRVKEYWEGFAASLQMQGNYQEALWAWSMRILLAEGDAFPHLHAAECLFSIGEITQGKQALLAAQNRDHEKKFSEKISLLLETWEGNHG